MVNENLTELLPLYLNDQLSASDTEVVRQALEEDDALQQELTFLQSIKDSIKKEDISSPADLGWMKLKRDIAAEQKGAEQIAMSAAESKKPGWWKTAAVAASIALVVQSGFLVQQYATQPEAYQLLSGEELRQALKVKFNAGVSESDIRALLLNLQGNIVKGPSAVGIYHIHFEDKQKAMTRLAASEVVEYAEEAAQE